MILLTQLRIYKTYLIRIAGEIRFYNSEPEFLPFAAENL